MDPNLTTCTLDCHDQCSILCERRDGVLRLRGNPEHPYTRGFTCAKIHRYPARLTSPHRIREPWMKRDGRFHPVDWVEAMEVVAARLSGALATDPRSVLWYRGSGSKGVTKTFTDYLFTELGARGLRGGLCDEAGCAALVADTGMQDMNDPAEIDTAETIVLWGKNPRACAVHLAAQVSRARKRGARVIAINPDLAEVASLADTAIPVRPGTDRYLALACAGLLLASGEQRQTPEKAANAAGFRALLAAHEPADLLERCGVSPLAAEPLVDAYRRTAKVATVVGWGVQRYPWGAATLRAIHALAFLAGTLGIPGAGLYYSIPSSRHLPRPRPGRTAPPGLSLPDLGRDLPRAAPPVRFAWITCANLLNQAPDTKRLREAMAAVETVVAVEGFWTETARQADVVLPPTLWLEEEDVVGSYWRNTVALARRVIEPPAGCRPDFGILQDLARRLGVSLPFTTAAQWQQACLPPDGPTLEELREHTWVDVPWPRVAWQDGFAHADGRFHLITDLGPESNPVDPHHPLRLISAVNRRTLHSQMLPEEQRSPWPVRLHPQTAEALGIGPGDPVRLVSRAGELEGEAYLDPLVHPEAVCSPRGGWVGLGMGVNEITTVQLTDMGEAAAYYDTRVRLERADAGR
ncbi:MAG: molybdopterin-dependent oxidoreductase [Deferrisomatales bacterium]|nr:molybdopterin-dependent oxidoreductase [Deferrisomatales bacterium]